MGMKEFKTRVRTEFKHDDHLLVFTGKIDGGPIKQHQVVFNDQIRNLPMLRKSKKFNVRIIQDGKHFIECLGRTDAGGDLYIEETKRVA